MLADIAAAAAVLFVRPAAGTAAAAYVVYSHRPLAFFSAYLYYI